jgi:hypothetical protein
VSRAVQSSVSAALVGVQTDLQQLDGKVAAWSQQSEGAWSGLREDLESLRRMTADDVSALSARMDRVEGLRVMLPSLCCTACTSLDMKNHSAHVLPCTSAFCVLTQECAEAHLELCCNHDYDPGRTTLKSL